MILCFLRRLLEYVMSAELSETCGFSVGLAWLDVQLHAQSLRSYQLFACPQGVVVSEAIRTTAVLTFSHLSALNGL